MPAPPATTAVVTNHPGSTAEDIDKEPQWGGGHQHRTGYLNRSGRIAGLTHDGDNAGPIENGADDHTFVEGARRQYRELQARREEGDLVNFDNVLRAQTVRSTLSVREWLSCLLGLGSAHELTSAIRTTVSINLRSILPD
jgi:hypothetical protein